MQIKILVEGGAMKPGPALSQKLGPVGININEVIKKVNEATEGFKGLKVPVVLEVDTATKEFEIKVSSPPMSELMKRELGIEKGSGAQGKMQVANASIEQVISVAKTKLPTLLANDLKAAVKCAIGSCVSLGVLIENKSAVEVAKEVEAGVYDKEIKEEKTETSEEKRKELDEHFSKTNAEQEKIMKQEKAAKDAEDEKKAEKAAAAPAEKKEEKKAEPKKK